MGFQFPIISGINKLESKKKLPLPNGDIYVPKILGGGGITPNVLEGNKYVV